jgi:tetratricopeptide (TPR) repeat protein
MLRRLPIAALSVSLIVITGVLPAEAKREEKGSEYVIGDRHLADQLAEAREWVNQEDFAEARSVLDSIRQNRLKPYPKGLIHLLYGYTAAGEEKYPEAAEEFRKALETEALPPSQMSAIRFNLAQIQMVSEEWQDAIETLHAWFAQEENPTSMAYYMLGVAYYQANQSQEALEPARKAVEMSDDPREPWLQLLIALHIANEDFAEALPPLEHLALRYPKRVYWTQLAAILMEMGRDEDSLAAQQLSQAQGFLEEERELERLAQMYVFVGLPWEGAQLMRQSIDTGVVHPDAEAWTLLANSLLTAREGEMALEPLERAAELAENGNGFVKLSQVHMQAERWQEASEALARAFEKGGLENPAYAHLLVGITAFQQKSLERARSSFALALGDERTREMAQTWMQFVEREAAAQAARQG